MVWYKYFDLLIWYSYVNLTTSMILSYITSVYIANFITNHDFLPGIYHCSISHGQYCSRVQGTGSLLSSG